MTRLPLALLVTSLVLFACSGSDVTPAAGAPDASGLNDTGHNSEEAQVQEASPEAGQHDAPEAGLADAPDSVSICAVTPANLLGPYYKPGAPERNVLVEPADPGVRITILGRVLTPDCQPIAHAQLDVWHADAAGAYDMAGFKFRGRFEADAAGHWELHTIVPGWYLNGATYRPAHIHVKVDAPGTAALTTQLYFEGDPYNDGDPFILPELIMHVKGPPEGPRSASFDIVLAPM